MILTQVMARERVEAEGGGEERGGEFELIEVGGGRGGGG